MEAILTTVAPVLKLISDTEALDRHPKRRRGTLALRGDLGLAACSARHA
jgi:hypothetical protein